MAAEFLRREAKISQTLREESRKEEVKYCYEEVKQSVDELLEYGQNDLMTRARNGENPITIWKQEYKAPLLSSLFYRKQAMEEYDRFTNKCNHMKEAMQLLGSYQGFSFEFKGDISRPNCFIQMYWDSPDHLHH